MRRGKSELNHTLLRRLTPSFEHFFLIVSNRIRVTKLILGEWLNTAWLVFARLSREQDYVLTGPCVMQQRIHGSSFQLFIKFVSKFHRNG